MNFVKGLIDTMAYELWRCLIRLPTEPTPDEHDPHAHKECGGKAKGKGQPLRMSLSPDDGPKRVRGCRVEGYKLWVGGLPGDIREEVIGHCCEGHVGISIQRHKTTSSMTDAVVTFIGKAMAVKAFEDLAMVRFHHGNGEMYCPSLKRLSCPE